MHGSLKRGLATGAVLAAAAAGSMVAAAPAEAAIEQGIYQANPGFLGLPYASVIGVTETTLTQFGPLGARNHPITDTATGGYIESFGVRYELNRTADGGYAGPVRIGPFRIGHATLTPS